MIMVHPKLGRRLAAIALPAVLSLTLAGSGVAYAENRSGSSQEEKNESGATMLNIPLGICITLVETCSTRSEAASGDASVDHDGHRDGNISPTERPDSGSGSQHFGYRQDNSAAADRAGETGATFLNIPIGLCLSLVDGCSTESRAGSGDAGIEPIRGQDDTSSN
jgi:hypothetical protein